MQREGGEKVGRSITLAGSSFYKSKFEIATNSIEQLSRFFKSTDPRLCCYTPRDLYFLFSS